MCKIKLLLTILILTSVIPAYSSGGDVPYVPTPPEVVNTMIRIAGVNNKDTLYDLGCGDGRIVIAAVKEADAAYAIGIDIDPVRIKEARENAQREGITKRVRFVQGNLFGADIHEATVVTMYLLPGVNIRLRSKLFSQLRPGSRIASHDFDMAEWSADSQVTVDNSMVYLWIIPSNASGVWNWKLNGVPYTVSIEQKYQKISASIPDHPGSTITAGLRGNKINLTIRNSKNSPSSEITFTGEVNGNTIRGNAFKANRTIQWNAVRKENTMSRIYDLEDSNEETFR